ncbi:MAG: ABC transporter permease subunit [Deltaproteobacteria bacterium]|jgi:NitT/TauT family transport system permease protein|nr:ABC transporter permease subunit [Deltaproteobacteria bacterium]
MPNNPEPPSDLKPEGGLTPTADPAPIASLTPEADPAPIAGLTPEADPAPIAGLEADAGLLRDTYFDPEGDLKTEAGESEPPFALPDRPSQIGRDGLFGNPSKLSLIQALSPYLIALGLWALLLFLSSLLFGAALAPGPLAVLKTLAKLAFQGTLFVDMAQTVLRALVGVLLANLVGGLLGLAAGRAGWALRITAPLVASLQACPPIVWVTIVMVWAGTGSLVPVATVFAATLPFVFSNTAQGVMGLEPRILAMGKLYDVPATRVWHLFILPGIAPFWLAGLSAVLATGWKAAAVAEFLGSHTGVGAKIYLSYQGLHMEDLQAWTLALIVLGLTLEAAVITPLRRKAAGLAARGAANP